MYVPFRAEHSTLKYILKQNTKKITTILWNEIAQNVNKGNMFL